MKKVHSEYDKKFWVDWFLAPDVYNNSPIKSWSNFIKQGAQTNSELTADGFPYIADLFILAQETIENSK